MAGLLSVTPSSRMGCVMRAIAPCASLPDPGQGSAPLLLCHCAEHICETKSYTCVSKGVMLKGGWLVVVMACVGSSEGMGVLVGAEITFT